VFLGQDAGFYELTLNMSNDNAQLTLDGVLVEDDESAEFDVGPISVKGNIFYDGLLGLLNSVGVETAGLAGLTPESPIERINQAIDEQLRRNQVVAGARAEFVGPTRDAQIAGVLAEAQTALLRSMLPLGGPRAIELLATTPLKLTHTAEGGPNLVPEPSALALLALGAVLALMRRRS
jgi:hypothetical protein